MKERLFYEFIVTPFYAQVAIMDEDTADIPGCETGEEAAVASDSAVLVGTCSDFDGDVRIQVFDGAEGVTGHVIFDGAITVTQPCIQIGSIVGAHLERFALTKIGKIRLVVFGDTLFWPSKLAIAFERGALSVDGG